MRKTTLLNFWGAGAQKRPREEEEAEAPAATEKASVKEKDDLQPQQPLAKRARRVIEEDDEEEIVEAVVKVDEGVTKPQKKEEKEEEKVIVEEMIGPTKVVAKDEKITAIVAAPVPVSVPEKPAKSGVAAKHNSDEVKGEEEAEAEDDDDFVDSDSEEVDEPLDDEDMAISSSSSSSAASSTRKGAVLPKKKSSKKQPTVSRKDGGVGSTAFAERYKAHPFVPDPLLTSSTKIPYLAIARTLEAIEATTKRLEIINLFSSLLRSVIATNPASLLHVIYLCTNQLGPTYAGIELGIGESLLIKAIASATGRTPAGVKKDFEKKGDLGTVAKESRSNQKTMFKPTPLTIDHVFRTFSQIASEKGNSSMNIKVDKIKGLLVACQEAEAVYIIRSLIGKLRIGLAQQNVLTAIAHAFTLTDARNPTTDLAVSMSIEALQERLNKSEDILKQIYSELPTYEAILPALLKDTIDNLREYCSLTPGIPLKPMLAHPSNGVSEIFQRFENKPFTCEFKYDGERAQIHKLLDGTIKIYSRNSEDHTPKFPDIIDFLPTCIKEGTQDFVIDCEAVAFDREQNKILPFQVLSTRAKKSVKIEEIKISVCLFAFDILYLNGKSLLSQSLGVRRQALYSIIEEKPGLVQFATHVESENTEDIEQFLQEAVEKQCEGLMVKTVDERSSYEPSRRSHRWLKLKKDYIQGMGDTIDLVVIGGYSGKGKRTGVYGGFLLACYDPENEEFQSICKIGTGFSDADLIAHSEFFKKHEKAVAPSYYSLPSNNKDFPDVYFEPVQVWEVKAADLSISPSYRAAIGIVDPEKGISLRFPRFMRIRDDKTPENATDSNQIADMYKAQSLCSKPLGGEDDDDDY